MTAFKAILNQPDIVAFYKKFKPFMCADAYGEPKLTITVKDMNISDVYSSSCGRFEVFPETYGLTNQEAICFNYLKTAIEDAVDSCLDAMCEPIQTKLGIETGDFASIYFSGGEALNAITQQAGDYLLAELRGLAND